MKIENLKIFLEVAQAESINKAASQLYTSHQNLNALIKKLEDEIGTTLFIRSNKGITLSENGKELYEAASQIVSIYDDFSQKIKKESDVIPFYVPVSLAVLCNNLQGYCLHEKYISIHKKDVDDLFDLLKRKKRGIYFLPVTGEHFNKWDSYKDSTIIATDLKSTVVCHKDNPILHSEHTITPRAITTISHDVQIPNAINIDDLDVCKKLMREEHFVYTTTESLYRAYFPEEAFICFHERALDYPVEFTLFFNLPTTDAYKEIRQQITERISVNFKK